MKVQVIVGAVREGRISDRAAKWVAKEAAKLEGAEVEIVDLRDYELPFFDEALPPQYNPNRTPNAVAQKWIAKLAEAEAYVIVSPEYNRALPGVLKNALEYIDFQMAKKPVALVTHGSTGGAQALATLRVTLPALQCAIVPVPTMFNDRVGEKIDEEGNLDETVKANPYGPQSALETTLADLKWYSDALSAARG